MTQILKICDMEYEPCLGSVPIDVQTKHYESGLIRHNKHIVSDVQVGSVKIPLRHRNRTFIMRTGAGWERVYEGYVGGMSGDAFPCFHEKFTYPLSVSEDAVWTDGSIYIADTEHSNAFWREVVYTCKFSGSSTDVVEFYPPIAMAGKLRINDVHYDVTATWKMAINGVVEELYKESYKFPIYTPDYPLFFIEPQPGGNPLDADFLPIGETLDGKPGKGYAFLDYRSHGGGPSDEEIASGGQDYYYPVYLRYMGINRSEDQADAVERFWDNFGSGRVKDSEVRNMMRPAVLGSNDPRGSIVRDYSGNTFASVTVTKRNGELLHFNKLVDSDGNPVGIPDTIAGDDIRYYPVGLI